MTIVSRSVLNRFKKYFLLDIKSHFCTSASMKREEKASNMVFWYEPWVKGVLCDRFNTLFSEATDKQTLVGEMGKVVEGRWEWEWSWRRRRRLF